MTSDSPISADRPDKDAERPKRGRPPRAEVAVQRRRELVETAYAVFSEKGYAAAGVNDITERLGVATGTFYRYFDGKRDILDHVIDLGVEKLFEAARTAWGDGPPPGFDPFVAHVRAVGDAIMATVEAEPGMIQMLLFEGTSVDRELTARLLTVHETLTEFTAAALDQGIARGYLRPDLDTRIIGRSIYMMLSPSMIDMMNGPLGPETRARHLDAILDLILHGVRA
ncbi:TetR/AcrR family transcriptional regulator [Nocardia sp. CDC160]|uniref:TetR/AcrR family transcriptional regulator n=1 Tax=Nocardia sp. CDC160 TaxID=3112166 RepID=UPI002DB9AEFB|nr:TetR/AcrR family transcriptional regulator [Nocardia sp. CDC160]MEC3919395.1 TetR/AcrR family transcriptional regulator [Nocardia sp. CDC160]